MATIITFKRTAPTEGYTGRKLRSKIILSDGAGVSYERRLVTDKGLLTSVYDHNDTHRMETSVGTDNGVVYISDGQTRTGRELVLDMSPKLGIVVPRIKKYEIASALRFSQ